MNCYYRIYVRNVTRLDSDEYEHKFEDPTSMTHTKCLEWIRARIEKDKDYPYSFEYRIHGPFYIGKGIL